VLHDLERALAEPGEGEVDSIPRAGWCDTGLDMFTVTFTKREMTASNRQGRGSVAGGDCGFALQYLRGISTGDGARTIPPESAIVLATTSAADDRR
jgi:hypothetical protein